MAGGDDDHPTETSALIFREDEAIQPVEPGAGIAPEAPADHSTSNHGTIAPNGSPNGDAETLERQISAQDRQKQHEGLPEVKKQLKYILPALSIGIYLSAADQTIIVSSYGKIGTDLNALNMTSWIATAYFLTLTSFQPLYGKLSDIFGRKACLLNAYAIFGIGCLFCGLAKDINQLIIARAIAGIGGGGMSTVVSIMLSDIVTLRERGTYQGYLNIIFAAGASSGAPLGGLLSDSVGWRWAFLGQVPLCVVAFIAVSFVLKLPQKDSSNWRQKLRRIDFLGAAVLISAVFMLLVALDRGSNVSWKATITIVSPRSRHTALHSFRFGRDQICQGTICSRSCNIQSHYDRLFSSLTSSASQHSWALYSTYRCTGKPWTVYRQLALDYVLFPIRSVESVGASLLAST